jgi:hypothetical protein
MESGAASSTIWSWRRPGRDRARMPGSGLRVLVLLLSLVLPAAGAGAQEWYDEPVEESGGVSVRGSVGFTADPKTFLMGLSVPISMGRNVHFSPLFQLGVDDGETIIAPSAQLEYHVDLSSSGRNEFVRRLRPILQLGAGFVFIHQEEPGKDDDEIGLLINSGLGLEFEVFEDLFLGTNLLFNVLPFEVSDENFFLSWHFASVRIRF